MFGRVTHLALTAPARTKPTRWSDVATTKKGVTQMLTMYLCGALITAVAAISVGIRLADPRISVSPLTRFSVAALAGAIWPVVAVGALSLAVVVPVLTRIETTSDAKVDARAWNEELAPVRAMATA